MARRARIRDLIFVRHRRRDEGKRMGAHFHIRHRGRDPRHMTCDATASGRSFLVMGVLLYGAGVGTIQRKRTVAFQT